MAAPCSSSPWRTRKQERKEPGFRSGVLGHATPPHHAGVLPTVSRLRTHNEDYLLNLSFQRCFSWGNLHSLLKNTRCTIRLIYLIYFFKGTSAMSAVSLSRVPIIFHIVLYFPGWKTTFFKQTWMLASLHTFEIVTLKEILRLIPHVNKKTGTSIQNHCLSKSISALLLFLFSYINEKHAAWR